jgi:5-(aminomethyl)-3-furanmethanol phosphate kinase
VRPGAVAILLPYALLRERDPLPASWDVTADSIAAWVAGAAGAGRLVLVKAAADAEASDVVDPYLPRALGDAGVEAWVIDGRAPERLGELLDTGRTAGTRISA